MDIIFPDSGFPPEFHGEIDDVLHRIAIGNAPGHWPSQPEEIRILGRLAGGRSGSEVLEVVIKDGPRKAHKVIKLGPADELAKEFMAYRQYLQHASVSFVRIEAATRGTLDRSLARSGQREAIVYDHASRFQGRPGSRTHTFEELARQAIQQGGATLEKAIGILETLFQGMRNDLYEQYHDDGRETTLEQSWNRRLGIDAVLAIDHVDSSRRVLETTGPAPFGTKQATLWPRDIAIASVRIAHTAMPGDTVQVYDAKMAWWGTHLMAEVDDHHLRLEIVADGPHPIDHLASLVEDGTTWTIHGRLLSLRMTTHLDHFLTGIGDDYHCAEGVLTGPGANVRDPFVALPDVLESRRAHRMTSIIHGDLNPRNILIIDGTPCVIDYAMTGDGEPMLMDFTRLEGCLAREVLPADSTWAQHVRLQRLLAAACRLGEEAAHRFVEQLTSERAELASAFRLLWSIRRAAHAVYPRDYLQQWTRDYLEQLFLFAHLTLKWNSAEELAPHKLRATGSMAGVAAEALLGRRVYRLWSNQALLDDGGVIIQIIQSQPETSLNELANLAPALHRLDAQQGEALWSAFEQVRATFVRQHFRDAAYAALDQLADDHDIFISLKAYIELKGQVRAGRRRMRETPEQMLEIDELLAEGERLRFSSSTGEDVLRLLAEHPAVVVIGDAGSGKSTVAREWQYQLTRAVVSQDTSATSLERSDASKTEKRHSGSLPFPDAKEVSALVAEPRMPIFLRAPDVAERLDTWKERDIRSTASVLGHSASDGDLLATGALYIIVDALNELDEGHKQRVADWIVSLRDAFPTTPILVCHRQYNYVPGLLPFPVITLQKVETEQARDYISTYLREKEVPNHEELAQRLIKLLLDDPEHEQVRDLAQTPLFLWMIVERYRQTGEIPRSRGGLFETFSRWYLEQRYHEIHHEVTRTTYSYEDKALLLGAIGYELVQRRATNLPKSDVQRLIPQEIKSRWRKILQEIIDAEMMYRDGKTLRFLHQSFQEYFAARHFLLNEASDQEAIRHKVRQLGWQDTFAVLLGFAADATEVITQVIQEALKVSPLLTSRCLRMAEQPDPRLLELFIDTQEAILLDPYAGEFSYERAAQALAEYGWEPARSALWRVVTARNAPATARVAVLKLLAAMPAQVRFELVADEVREELLNTLPHLFHEGGPLLVQQAAIDVIVTAQLKDLGMYLAELIVASEWLLRRSAWQACETLGLKRTPHQQAAFVAACREQLNKVEEELYHETITGKMDALNEERMDILRQLATPANLPLLLRRRFGYDIHDAVGALVDQAMLRDGEPPPEAQSAWIVLTEQPEDTTTTIDHWLPLLRGPDDLTAFAAVHRLLKLDEDDLFQEEKERFPREKLRPFLDLTLPPERLSAVAQLMVVYGDKSLVEPLEVMIRSLMETITTTQEFEAFTNLIDALTKLNGSLSNRLMAIAESNISIRYGIDPDSSGCNFFPWIKMSESLDLSEEDYQMLLIAGDNDARAAISLLASWSASILREADRAYDPQKLDNTAMQQFQNLAESEQDLDWQHEFARAAATVHAVGLLPWLNQVALIPEMAKKTYVVYNPKYGRCVSFYLGTILSTIGYLARVLIDQKSADRARAEVTFLREQYARLHQDEERSIVVGLTIGLGYLGEWEPLLRHLGAGEPWMHKAAQNVFKYWVPSPLNGSSADDQREEAARWITRWLRGHSDLSPQARSTLERIKDQLETQLGYYVLPDEA